MFSSHPNVLLHITRAAIKAYTKKGEGGQLALPSEAVQYLEIYDRQPLNDAVNQFIAEQRLAGTRLAVILDESLLFEKTIPATKESEQQFADFEAMLPFEPTDRQTVAVPTENHAAFKVFATNKNFYMSILTPFIKSDCKVLAVLPASALGLKPGAGIATDAVGPLLRTVNRYRRVQFALTS